MKRIFTILLTIFLCATASAQIENSIVLDRSTFRAVQSDALTGVNIDPIGVDRSRRACARLKIFFHRMTREQMEQLEPVFPSGTIDYTKCKVAEGNTVLILEFTARPQVKFYLKHPTFGTSNEVEFDFEGDKEYQLEASLNQTYSIVVNSNVTNADVYLDGVFKGKTDSSNSLTIKDVMIGGHRLKVQYGNVSAEQTIEVNDSSISFRLSVNTAASEPQYVVFAVEPKTASVIIDDKPLPLDEGGAVTTVLQAGTYSYSVSAKMYHTQRGTFTVAGAKVQKSVTLVPAFGYLSVGGGMVNGATVFVDDENIGTAPVKSDKLASGEHSVRIVKGKYKPYSTTVTIRDNQTTTLAPTLSADFATVTLTTASGATIWVNGVEKGSGSWSGELSTGTYIFEARQRGHRPAQISKTIAATPSRQSYAIPAPTPIVGSVDITSSPAMADITLDGKVVGTTPLKLSSLLVGQHKLTVSKSGYQPYTTTITIAEGRTATVSATLKKQVAQVQNTPSSISANFGDIEMVFVKGGTFTMGATSEQGSDAESDEKPTHSVTLSDYYIGKYEVTQAQWSAVMGSNPSYFTGDNLPVENVSWNDIQVFIQKLNEKTGKNFRLPTEAEWEYAARGGDKSNGYKYSGSNTIGDVAWYSDNSYGRTHPVGQKHPNKLGVYDMTGNVREWCSDWYGSYSSSSQTNPTGPSSGSGRVLRGGSWNNDVRICRVSNRFISISSNRYSRNGFRLVCSADLNTPTPTAVASTTKTTTKTYKVGDYYNDGVKEGVVFEVSADGRHGKIVSMTQSSAELKWSSDYAEQKRIIGANSTTDGVANMAKVKAITGWRDKYPPFAWCADLGEGWYLPSKEELLTIYKNKGKLNPKLTDKISEGWYWSSTEFNYQYSGYFCVWYVDMYIGITNYSNKSNNSYVRAVSAFGDSSKTESAATTVLNRKSSVQYKVGDYYNKNGKEGVVFEVSADGRHGKIVSMKQSAKELDWSSDRTEQKRLIGANSKTDGAANMAKVKAISGWRDKYPAFKWCANLGEGWYLPAKEELLTIYKNRDKLNSKLTDQLSGGYWSSTEDNFQFSSGNLYVWRVNMYSGGIAYLEKCYNNYVRAVSAF